jgi:hypothetical protein
VIAPFGGERENLGILKKTGAGEGIRILYPKLGKVVIYEISILNQLFKRPPKYPNTIRAFSVQFARKALCAMF